MGARPLTYMVIGILVAIGLFSLAPASAGACSSLSGVHSFNGHVLVTFSGTASGTIEGTSGVETISLDRQAADVELKLNHKSVGKRQFSGIITFSGKARMGTVTVNDSFAFSGSGSSATETFSGPETSPFGGASLILDTDDCRYVLNIGIGAKTMFNGDAELNPGPGVLVYAYGDRNRIPRNLHLVGGVGPGAYVECPGDPLQTGEPCLQLVGGWATDFGELKHCGSFPPQGDCASSPKPVGDGKFIWVLKPH